MYSIGLGTENADTAIAKSAFLEAPKCDYVFMLPL